MDTLVNELTAPSAPTEPLVHPRYRVFGQIGSGGMGVVYCALQLQLDRIVAVKVIHRQLTKKPGFAERFAREVKALARLNHPNVVAAHDADQALAVGLRERDTVFTTLPGVWDFVRARPTVELSDLRIDSAEGLTQKHPLQGSIAYRFLTPPRAGGYLRLMYYLPDYKHVVMLNHIPKGSLATHGEFSFRFDSLGFGPFRDQQLTVLFAEWVTRDGQEEVVEGPAAATLLRCYSTKVVVNSSQ